MNIRENNRIAQILIVALSGVMFFACEKKNDPFKQIVNPIEKEISETTILLPQANAQFDTNAVVIEWSNSDISVVDKFLITLDDEEIEIQKTQTRYIWNKLDDGAHIVMVRALHKDRITLEQATEKNKRTISTDMYSRSTDLILVKHRTKTNVGKSFTIQVRAHNMVNISALSFFIDYTNSIFTIQKIIKGELLNGLTSTVDITNTNINSQTATSGRAEINVITVSSSNQGISGTGLLYTLECYAQRAGTANINFAKDRAFVYRDTSNVTISFAGRFRDGEVIVLP